MASRVLRRRSLPVDFIEPCLPTIVPRPPSGPDWLHEIKHDGYRMMIRRDGAGVRLLSRNGYDFTQRYPLIAAAGRALRGKSFLIDGEAVACDEGGLAVFQRLRRRRHDATVFLYAFDVIEWNGEDLRRQPLEDRQQRLTRLVGGGAHGIRISEHIAGDGALVFHHACRFGCEGIVSKRRGSSYRSGRSRDWLKCKNPESPAVKRLADENWS